MLTDMDQERQGGHPTLKLDVHSDRSVCGYTPRAVGRHLHLWHPCPSSHAHQCARDLGGEEQEPP
ncbi:hypothetical protein CSPAE12_08175 [Colletotrichum incanum]|nr:hypothetical protein CSPAE12_08175 [Colletotrichum incanum]